MLRSAIGQLVRRSTVVSRSASHSVQAAGGAAVAHHHPEIMTYDHMPVPEGSWTEGHKNMNAKFNQWLAVSFAVFGVSMVVGWYAHVFNFDAGSPPKAYKNRTNDFYKVAA